MFRKYFINRSIFKCPECGRYFEQTFWQWFFSLVHNDITRHRYVKCPYCKVRHWLQAAKVVK